MGSPDQATKHDADHGEAHESRGGSGATLEVACQAAIAADPGQGSFDDPAFGEDDEVMSIAALDDLDHPAAGIGDRLCDLRSLIAGIGEDALDEGEGAACIAQNIAHAVTILNVGRMDDDAQEK